MGRRFQESDRIPNARWDGVPQSILTPGAWPGEIPRREDGLTHSPTRNPTGMIDSV
jgi:hypothetical protein